MNSCGDCTACCTVIGVEELGKGNFCQCPHLTESGCSIYEKRPTSCRAYACVWRLGVFELAKDEIHSRYEKEGPTWWESFSPSQSQYRPDKLGVLFTISSNTREFCAYETRGCCIDMTEATKALVTISDKLPYSVPADVVLHKFPKLNTTP